MKKERHYYEAYDDRYKQVHQRSLKWFSDSPSRIVEETLLKYKTNDNPKIIELGCGEGRDAVYLLNKGYHVTATDISPVVIEHCKEWFPDYSCSFTVLDCLSRRLNDTFDSQTLLSVTNFDKGLAEGMASYQNIVAAMGLAMLVITLAVVTLVLYFMISSSVIRQKRDLGVQKAIGFTTFQLMNQLCIIFLCQY